MLRNGRNEFLKSCVIFFLISRNGTPHSLLIYYAKVCNLMGFKLHEKHFVAVNDVISIDPQIICFYHFLSLLNDQVISIYAIKFAKIW